MANEEAREAAALNAAIDHLAPTTVLSRDEATTIAMNYPEPGFLTFLSHYGALYSRLGIHGLYAAYQSGPIVLDAIDALGEDDRG